MTFWISDEEKEFGKQWAHKHHESLSLVEKGEVAGYISAISCPTIYYLLQGPASHGKAIACIRELLSLCQIIEVNRRILEAALDLPVKDYQDNIQIACAQKAGVEYIITRNKRDFRQSPVPAMTPEEYLCVPNAGSERI